MYKFIAIVALFLGLFVAHPVKADGSCGMLFTLEGFKNIMETQNPDLQFHRMWSLSRPRQAGYYFEKNAERNPQRNASVILIEYGCVSIQIASIIDVEEK